MHTALELKSYGKLNLKISQFLCADNYALFLQASSPN